MALESQRDETRNISKADLHDRERFGGLFESHRPELVVHCYRMLGSLGDAEDMVQEVGLRAWQKLDTFRGEATLRSWLYKIATNACLDELRKRTRRTLPHYHGPPANPSEPFAPISDPIWLEPLPDGYFSSLVPNPEAKTSTRESVKLAFLVALQALPPRQRAILLLRDVLDWRAHEVAELLDTTESAVTSALHRARQRLANEHRGTDDAPGADAFAIEPVRSVLNRYMQAWENADIQGLTALLQAEATLAMPPTTAWYQGRANIALFLQAHVFTQKEPGQWRLRPLRANAQPAFAVYVKQNGSDVYAPFGLQVLSVTAQQIEDILLFVDPEVLSRFEPPA